MRGRIECPLTGELCFPNWKKITKHSSVCFFDDQYEFLLPSHKANCFSEAIVLSLKTKQFCNLNPIFVFHHYIASHDSLFPFSSPLWLTSTSKVPTHDFFITRLHHYFKKDVSSQSMRVGGATSLAEHGIPPSLIQLMGCWSSEAFLIYIQKISCLFKPFSIQLTHLNIFLTKKSLLYLISYFFISSHQLFHHKKINKSLVSLTYSK